MCDNDIQVCEQLIRIQVIGIWRVSCVHGIYVFESVSWKQMLQLVLNSVGISSLNRADGGIEGWRDRGRGTGLFLHIAKL